MLIFRLFEHTSPLLQWIGKRMQKILFAGGHKLMMSASEMLHNASLSFSFDSNAYFMNSKSQVGGDMEKEQVLFLISNKN